MSTQEQRKRFEIWFRQQHGWWEVPLSLDTGEWEAWQAAEAAAIERCAKACEDYAKERRPDTWSLSGEGEALGAEVCAERIRALLNADGEET